MNAFLYSDGIRFIWSALEDANVAIEVPPITITKAGMLISAAGLPPSMITERSRHPIAPAMPMAVLAFNALPILWR